MKKNLSLISFLVLFSLLSKAQVSGIVYRDFNTSGIKENTGTYNEPGVTGISVTATLANGTSFTTTTDASGAYSFTAGQVPSGTAVRIEFTATMPSSFQGSSNGTSVQFVTGGTSNVDYAMNNPDDYWDNTGNPIPNILVVHQNRGTLTNPENSGKKALLQTTNDATGPNNPATSTTMTIDTSKRPSLHVEVGSTFALSYHARQERFFQAAFLKRMSAFGPKGPGGLYIMAKGAGSVYDLASSFDLNAVVPLNSATALDFGTVTRTTTPGTGAAQANYISVNSQWTLSTGSDGRDNDAFFKVGTMSIGGVDVDRCYDTMYVMNMFQKSLVVMDISGTTSSLNNATTSALGSLVKAYDLASLPGYPSAVGSGNNIRPFAVKIYGGKGYIGVVSDAMGTQSLNDLKGYILQFDPHNITAGFTNILTINFNAYSGSFWHPWISTWAQAGGTNSHGPVSFPQPMITDIEFNEDGSMDIGIRDRWGDQGAAFDFWPVNTPSTTVGHDQTVGQGDVLHVCNVSGTWAIEGTSGSCTQLLTNGSAGNNPVGFDASYGNTGKEFYGDHAGDDNPEDGFGGLAKIMGTKKLVSTCLDPIINGATQGSNYWSTSGLKWNDNTSGIVSQIARTLNGDFNSLDKANSLGDLEFVQPCPKIQIGNRLWVDADSDGIQDADELPIPSATVELVAPGIDGVFGTIDDIVVASTTTNSDGSYYFSALTTADTRKPAAWTGVGTNDILPGYDYQIRVPLSQSAITTNNYSVGTSNVNSNGSDLIDSDGDPLTANGADYSAVVINSNLTNHNFDFGFMAPPACTKPDAGADMTACGSTCINLTAVTPTTGTWTEQSGNPTGVTLGTTTTGVAEACFTSTASGTFNFIYTVTGGCTDTMSVVVTPKPDAGPDQTTCFMSGNGTATLAATGTGIWTEQSGNPGTSTITTSTSATTTVTNFSVAGTYNYIWTNGGCTDTVSVAVTPNGTVGNYVWNDINGNGLNDEAATDGINGITVELWKETSSGSGIFALASSTTTANDGSSNPGYYNFIICESANYQVKFPTSNAGANLTTQTSTPATDNNSDANPVDGLSPSFAIDVNGAGTSKDNPTIDAAYYGAPVCSLSTVPLLTMSGLSFGSGSAPLAEDVTTDGSFVLSENNIAGFNVGTSSEGPFFTFCTEINQPLLPLQNPYTHELNGTANGFTASQAYRIAQVIQASGFNNATGFGAGNNTTVNMVALQFAIWNSLYDTDYTVTAGNFQSFTDNNGARTQANTWLSAAQNITTPSIVVHKLHNATGQDLFMIGDVPPITVNPVSPTCSGANAPDNGGLTINGFTAGQRYQYSTGTTFASGSAIPASITAIPVGGNIVSTLTNNSESYTIRIYDATDDNCYTDRTVSIVSVLCCTNHNAGPDQTTCFMNGNGTATLAATGTGTWTEQSGNPGTSTITNNTSATTTVTSFSAAGTYNYIWTDGGCIDTVSVIVTPNGTIGNYVWNDLNGNGLNDEPSMAGINGVTVELWKETAPGSGTYALASNTTTANDGSSNPGYYNFIICESANYEVKFPLSNSGNSLTTQTTSAATDNNSDASPVDGLSPSFAIDVNGAGTAKDNPTIDAAYAPSLLNAIGNYVWLDNNKDGIQDAGEPGVANIPVSLFLNGTDGLPGTTDDILVSSTSTDAYGKYLFTNLPDGDYNVGFTLPSNYEFTSTTGSSDTDPANSDANITTGRTSTANLAGGETELDMDAGIIFSTPPALSSLGDYVWYDTNGDGIQDANESPIAGVTVTLCDPATGNVLAITTTNANGEYLFNDLPNGDYQVGFSPKPGTIFTQNNGGTTPGNTTTNSDANPTTGKTGTVSITAAGTVITGLDAGFKDDPKASLGDLVWIDLNHDGLQDASEPGVPGVTMTLYSAGQDGVIGGGDDVMLGTTTTDANGNYLFSNLDPAKYFVTATPVAGYTITTQDAGTDDLKDNDFGTNAAYPAVMTTSQVYNLLAGQNYPGVDMGIYNTIPGLGSLGDKVWFDLDGDGVQDPTEYGVGGVTVCLLDGTGATVNNPATGDPYILQTDANGNYLFTDLPAGNYEVAFKNIPEGTSFSPTGAGTTATDSDPNAATGVTGVIALGAGQNITDVDAGIVPGIPSGKGSLGNLVWIDANNDGIQDAGEQGVPGVTVNLYEDTNGDGAINGAEATTPVATQVTDAQGFYMFTGLDAGTYQVGFVTSTIPAGYALQTGKNDQGTNDALDSDPNPTTGLTGLYNLAQGEDNLTVDAGIYNPTATNSVGDKVWLDQNADGLQTSGEPGVPGVSVSLLDASGTVIATTITDANGNYHFGNLPNGTYSVQVAPPAGFNVTTQNTGADDTADSDIDPLTGTTASVTLTGGTNITDLDAGLTTTRAALGNYVWLDTNKDGIQDAGELGVPGVTVLLTRPGFGPDGIAGNADDANPVASAITDGNGLYFFSNLEPGTYDVQFTTIPSGLSYTTQNVTTPNDAGDSDADPITGMISGITLAAGQVDPTNDGGLIPVELGSVGDIAWFDVNHDGIRDAGEAPVPGTTVTLKDALGSVVGTAITDGTGHFLFTNVPAGTGYTLTFGNLPTGATITAQGVGPTSTNSDADPTTGVTAPFVVVGGAKTPNIDAGVTLYIPLPVALENFAVTKNDCKVSVSWTTSSEQNVSHFTLMRKAMNETQFTAIAKIKAVGNSSTAQHYGYKEGSLANGNYIYYVNTSDIDGQQFASDMQSITLDCKSNTINVFPNPATDQINIRFNSTAFVDYAIRVTDMTGKIIMTTNTTVEPGTKVVVIPVSNFAQGLYHVSVSSENGTETFNVNIGK